MTSLLAWIGIDSRGPSSCYLASDSRISWGLDTSFDRGRKLFTCHNSPDIFGYCGEVLFLSLLLSQASEVIDLRASKDMANVRHEAMLGLVKASFESYPVAQRRAFTLLHCARNSKGMAASFQLWRTDWDTNRGWSDQEIELPAHSAVILAVGSGKAAVESRDTQWKYSEVGRTSRAVFSAFCDALQSGIDPFTGGAPQLVRLYREGAGEPVGIIYQGARYLLGVPFTMEEIRSISVEWRNELFERCEGHFMNRLQGAQRHSRPKHL